MKDYQINKFLETVIFQVIIHYTIKNYQINKFLETVIYQVIISEYHSFDICYIVNFNTLYVTLHAIHDMLLSLIRTLKQNCHKLQILCQNSDNRHK